MTAAPTLGALPLVDLNPLHWLGDKVSEGLAGAFSSAMMGLWSAALWLMDMAFGVIDRFLTPDVTDASLDRLYNITLWLSLLVALVIGFGQIGIAALRQDGRSLASLATGIAQYGAVVTGWLAVCAGLIYGCAGLTRALLSQLLQVPDFAGYSAAAAMPHTVSGTAQAAVLGVCALFLVIPAAFGYLIIMLVREAGLLVLVATMPIAAAGALGEGTKAWMWKSTRWFIAACLTAPLLALVVGLGVQLSQAAFPQRGHATTSRHEVALMADTSQPANQPPNQQGPQTGAQGSEEQIGMAVVGCAVFAIACFCPMVLFRLLAFVDPGTASGASFRTTLAANGGVAGLLSKPSSDQGSGAATQTAPDGRTASETGAEADTANRFQSRTAKALGLAGGAAAKTMGAIGTVASTGASMSVDVMGQAGIGHQGYYDTTPPRRPGRPSPQQTRVGHGYDSGTGAGEGVANDPLNDLHIAAPGGDGAEGREGFIAEAGEDGAMLA